MSLYRFAVGLIVVLAVFAVKAGVGLYCGVISRSGKYQKVSLVIGFQVVYFLLFLTFCLLWKHIDQYSNLRALLDFARYGTDIHFTVSIGLVVWGVWLLKSESVGRSINTGAWIALLIPCPVCMTVIFFTMGFVTTYFPGALLKITGMAWGFFVGIGFLVFYLIHLLNKRIENLYLDEVVALTMIVCASYTMLTLLFGLGVKEAPRIYNMVVNKELIPGGYDMKVKLGTIFLCVSTFVGSFYSGFLRYKRGRVPAPGEYDL